VSYQREWPSVFDTERLRIQEALGDELAAVEHVGSTSVEGLAALEFFETSGRNLLAAFR
jgi:GrpB-like predicted nucleotidyltransferase (UPF0157 family)